MQALLSSSVNVGGAADMLLHFLSVGPHDLISVTDTDLPWYLYLQLDIFLVYSLLLLTLAVLLRLAWALLVSICTRPSSRRHVKAFLSNPNFNTRYTPSKLNESDFAAGFAADMASLSALGGHPQNHPLLSKTGQEGGGAASLMAQQQAQQAAMSSPAATSMGRRQEAL